MAYKVLNAGRRLEGLPPVQVIRECSEEVREAHASWREALEALEEPTTALQSATDAARAAVLEETGGRDDNAVRARTRDEARALKDAESSLLAAARSLVEVLKEHAGEIVEVAARRRLRAFVAACDAVPAVVGFCGMGGAAGRVTTLSDRAPGLSATSLARPDMATVVGSLVETDVPALLERAGWTAETLTLVEIRDTRGRSALVTPDLAFLVTKRGGWTLVPREEG